MHNKSAKERYFFPNTIQLKKSYIFADVSNVTDHHDLHKLGNKWRMKTATI